MYIYSQYNRRTYNAVSVEGRALWADHSEECLCSANENFRHEADGRGFSSHTILSQLQHAFVQTQKSDSRFQREVRLWCHLTNVWMKRRQQQCGSCQARATRCFLTCCASFGQLPNCFLFLCVGRGKLFTQGTARCREHIKWTPGRGEDFPVLPRFC